MRPVFLFLSVILLSLATMSCEETPESVFDKGVSAYKEGDYSTAIALFEDAADEGYGPAGTALGKMYAQGLGVAQDDYKAFHYFYNVGARDCDPEGEFLTGLCYYDGVGTAKNEVMGIDFIIKAASRGYTDAIGFCVERNIKYD